MKKLQNSKPPLRTKLFILTAFTVLLLLSGWGLLNTNSVEGEGDLRPMASISVPADNSKPADNANELATPIPIIPTPPTQTAPQEITQPASTLLTQANIDKVYVDKSEQVLFLMEDGEVIKSYHIALGDSPQGHKQQEGDERTPEGIYTLDYKNENSIAYRSIHVSYPNSTDIANAQARSVSPGGAIMIHGQMNGYGDLANIMQQRNWTDGCMAVTDDEMDEIMDAVSVGTPIEIVW